MYRYSTYVRTMYLHVCIVDMSIYVCITCMRLCMYIHTIRTLHPSIHTVCLSSALNLFLVAHPHLSSPPGFNDIELLREMFASSRTARCRSRFVVPVILLNDHTHICRSATLSTYAELCGRQGYDWLSSELISLMFLFLPCYPQYTYDKNYNNKLLVSVLIYVCTWHSFL